jgi:hypothetical protein
MMAQNGKQPDGEQFSGGWHLSKSVSLSHIISTLVIALSLFAWGNKMDVRVSLLEQKDMVNERNADRIEAKVDALNSKIDRLIEFNQRQLSLARENQASVR